MINTGLNINKAFRFQVKKIMNTTFGARTQPFIKATLLKKKTRVLALIMFYDTRAENIAYRVFSCVIYSIIKNYVCIDYLAHQSNFLSEIHVGSGGGYKHG